MQPMIECAGDPRAMGQAQGLACRSAVQERLDLIYERITQLRSEGYPVRAITPQGAIYLSVQFDLVGRHLPNGTLVESNEQIRSYLLEEARVAVVPFRAFGLLEENGWFRMSVGAVGVDELGSALERVAAAIKRVS